MERNRFRMEMTTTSDDFVLLASLAPSAGAVGRSVLSPAWNDL